MSLLIQSLPLLALVVLLASGRASAMSACLTALLLTLPAALLAVPAGADRAGWMASFLLAGMGQGLWLALIPVGIILGGLVFHASAAGPDDARPEGDPVDTLFTGAFLLGGFTETVTGFGIGAIFALAAFRRVGVTGLPAATIALFSQMLIPWGGLGPGTAVGAALAGLAPQALAGRNALILAAELPLVLPLFWHLCAIAGHPVPTRRRVAQLLWLLAESALLVALHHLVPWEVCGLLATGLVLTVRLLHADPPRGADGWIVRLRAAFPYLLLAGTLLGSRLWRGAPALAPFPALPALPLNHAVFGLWLVGLILAIAAGRPLATVKGALHRGARPALTLLLFVLLARFLAGAGVPQALAGALAGIFGSAAPYAAPLLAGIAGFFAGTNVGSNAAMMPLQAELGRVAGIGPLVLPAVQNGTLFLMLSPQAAAVISGLAGGGASPRGIWRLAWPIFPLSLAVGMAFIALS
jgi:lactate permease